MWLHSQLRHISALAVVARGQRSCALPSERCDEQDGECSIRHGAPVRGHGDLATSWGLNMVKVHNDTCKIYTAAG
jgi:hypothetical protein